VGATEDAASRRPARPGDSAPDREASSFDAIFLAVPGHVGPGIRLAVKDLFDTAGLTTTYGSVIFAEHVPERSAAAVELLEAAGYANVGKTNLHEFAYGVTSQNPHFGTVPNPVAPGRVAGGSSGGSAAAVAAGLADVALGSDSGGSIRIPSAWCGLVGFKPTFDVVAMEGCFPLAPSFDHAGPMARSARECVAMLDALAPEFEPIESVSLDELDVAVAWTELADPLVRERVEAAAALFPRTTRVEFPLASGVGPLFMREVADVHRGLFPERAEDYGDNVRTKLERCLAVTGSEVEISRRAREEHRAEAERALGKADLLLTPTLAFVAPPADVVELEIRVRAIQFTIPFNSLGWPALALPCGTAEDGLPASVQLVGRPGMDALVLAAGEALEAALSK
jgi:aspartyl-tRNA(Asn)/glutamyl-tRNA(Gln) amidotransferase subunit A